LPVRPSPRTARRARVGETHTRGALYTHRSRKDGLSRAGYPFRGCDGANDKVWTGRLYTHSLARSTLCSIMEERWRHRTAPLTRSRCFKHTSTSRLHTHHTDGEAQSHSSCCSACAYSSPKDGTSVCLPLYFHHPTYHTSPDGSTTIGTSLDPSLTRHSRILTRHLPPKPLPCLPLPEIRPRARTR
jgi:hypothetical protein